MKNSKMLLIALLSVIIFASCTTVGKNGEFVTRQVIENKKYGYVYEIADCDIPTLKFMHSKGQIIGEATVTQKEIRLVDGFGWVRHQKKELTWSDGSITVERENAYKLEKRWIETFVNGNYNISTLLYHNMGTKNMNYPNPKYQRNNNIFSKYDLVGDDVAQTIAESRLLDAMNAVNGQAIFMPNYSWSYNYADTSHKPYKVQKTSNGKKFKTHEETQTKVIHLKITATAVDFLTQQDTEIDF